MKIIKRLGEDHDVEVKRWKHLFELLRSSNNEAPVEDPDDTTDEDAGDTTDDTTYDDDTANTTDDMDDDITLDNDTNDGDDIEDMFIEDSCNCVPEPILNPTEPMSYILVGDNVDKTIKASHMSMEHQSQSIHYFQFYAARDRIDFHYLSNDSCVGNVSELSMSSFLPTIEDCSQMRDNYAILIGRELVKKLPYFHVFADCVPMHILHEHSEAMSMKSLLVCTAFVI